MNNKKWIIEKLNNYSDKIALINEHTEYTYNDLINKYEFWISKLNNIEHGSVIVIASDFAAENIGCLLAAANREAIIILIDNNDFKENLNKIISFLTPNIVINNNEVQIISKLKVDYKLLNELRNKKHAGLILLTSGTTGVPKFVVHDFTKMLEKYKKDGTAFVTITFLMSDHIGGLNTLFYTIFNGGTLIKTSNHSVTSVCSSIEKYRVELLPTTPTFLNLVIYSQYYNQYDLSSLKIISYGTEVMPQTLLKKCYKQFPNIKFKQTYGMSEIGILKTKSESNNSTWIKIIENDNLKIKIENNILYIKSTSTMLGYLNNDTIIKDQWFNTGDEVIEKNGYIKILGRNSDIINVAGIRNCAVNAVPTHIVEQCSPIFNKWNIRC